MPIELLAGWMLCWGALPVLLAPRARLAFVVAAAAGFDLLVMPRCAPVISLGPDWLIGEAIALAICLVPAQLLARWTRDQRHLVGRALLQVSFAASILWFVPAIVFRYGDAHGGGQGWRILLAYDPRWLQIALQVVLIAAVPGVSAVQEFVQRGHGTPIPFDPPRRLVTTGIYAYLANPMQLSAACTLLLWGALLRNAWVASSSVMALIYGVGVAAWDEDRDLAARFGDRWRAYRREVHDWRPRWRPYVDPDAGPATLYVASTCGPCSDIAAWVQRRRPRGLRIVPAEQHPTRDLWRITYAAPDGLDADGIAALARALEHLHLGWAFAGMVLRLPVIRPCVQRLVDATGGGARHIPRTCAPNSP
jgi:protein-S-isoprenylcysteine O-methyltransferase Ste14